MGFLKSYKKLLESLVYFIFIFSLILGYNSYASLWHSVEIWKTDSFFYFEVPFVFVLILLLYFPKIKNRVIKYTIPFIPIIVGYLFFDIFYAFLTRIPRFSDLENIFSVYNFYPLMFFAAIALMAMILFLLFLLFRAAQKSYTARELKYSIAVRSLLFIGIVTFTQTHIFSSYHKNLFVHIIWSDKRTIQNNGRMSNFVFFSNLEKENHAKILAQSKSEISIAKTLYSAPLVERRNVYVVVLESFINPNFLKDIEFSQNPIAKELLPYLNNGKFSTVISPVYGGDTAQVEFELLTGIQALSKVSTIEFNIMRGGKLHGFLNQLRTNNYATVATVAMGPHYFNSQLAYQSLGFDRVLYMEEVKDYKMNKDDWVIFDGDAFDYNLKIVKNHLKTSKKPLFNYVIGMYGHLPYIRNEKHRPSIIKIKNSNEKDIESVSNQCYYRTKALAEYLSKLQKLDPNGLILVTSDHIPPILNEKVAYRYEKHTNIALLLDKGKNIDISGKKQYEIPWLIWDILSKNETKRDTTITTMEKLYFKALNQSIN